MTNEAAGGLPSASALQRQLRDAISVTNDASDQPESSASSVQVESSQIDENRQNPATNVNDRTNGSLPATIRCPSLPRGPPMPYPHPIPAPELCRSSRLHKTPSRDDDSRFFVSSYGKSPTNARDQPGGKVDNDLPALHEDDNEDGEAVERHRSAR